ncbi:MAG: hypothetical protein HY098_02710 [Nitrospinae bacterium]|nr:hypothetical protein [Nitrospinota bacterium]
MMKKITCSLLVSFALVACSTGPATKAKFDALQLGMTYEEAVKVIGAQGELVSNKRLSPGIPKPGEKDEQVSYAKTYKWKNSADKWITAVFENGKLTRKGESGL